MLNPAQKAVAFERLGFKLNEAQMAIATDESKVRLVAGGERAGKSLLAGAETAAAALTSPLLWICAADFSLARQEFTYAHGALQRLKAVAHASMPSDGRWEMRLKTGAIVTTRSAEDILKIAADAPSGIVMAEAAQMDFETFRRLHARTLEGRARGDGWLLGVGTFEKGRRWYAELFRQFKSPNPYGGRSFSLPTWTNTSLFTGRDDPHIKDQEATMSPEQFRERMGGEPVAHEDQVFNGASIERCIGPLGQPDGGVRIGLDVARIRDYSVAIAVNSLRQVVAIERFRKVDWVLQVQRVKEMYVRLKAKQIAIDSTGVGDPLQELLWRAGMNVNPVTITANSKAEMIDRLSIALDKGEITIPRDETLIAELWDFQATERASGHDKLEAPEGKHDDMVIALALAVHALRGAPVGVAPDLPPLNETDEQRWIREHVESESIPEHQRWGRNGLGEWD